MFRATNQPVKGARAQVGKLYPLTIPYKGMDARSPFAVMPQDNAINLVNVLAETYGLRTRKGYSEWATNIPGGAIPVPTVMSYYPATSDPTVFSTEKGPYVPSPMFVIPNTPAQNAIPAGKLFAAKGNKIYNVTAGGAGPWVAEVGVGAVGDYWTSVMLQNIAGAHLLATNDNGGYAIYSGAGWVTPVPGVGVGQIDGCDPAKFSYISLYKKRPWFVEKNSTRAWYLPVDQITGKVTAFDFGSQFKHGGELVAILNWTMDSGEGLEDQLVAVGSQGDVAIYQGIDPEDPAGFSIVGNYYVGPLPVGRRQCMADGGDVFILTQFGIQQVSKIQSAQSLAAQTLQHQTTIIDPLIARIMQTDAGIQGWQLLSIPREELTAIGIPRQTTTYGGDFLAYKTTTSAWSRLADTGYAHTVNIGTQVFAGTYDGRVVLAFSGVLDNVLLGTKTGKGINCSVLPAYNSLGSPGMFKHVMMIRPTFLTSATPNLAIRILVDYGPPNTPTIPTLILTNSYLWNDPDSLWNAARWGGLQLPIKSWLGCSGVGFAIAPSLDYICGGDTLLTNIDLWCEDGGPM